MQYKILAVSAFAAVASAQNATQSAENVVSVISVLETALPSSLIAEALTNSAAVSGEIASQFAAGQTPSWFKALPTDVQTFLVPGTANATNAAGAGTLLAPTASANSTSTRSKSHTDLTTITSTQSASESSNEATASRGSATASGASSTSSGGAAMPTAGGLLGMGLAGAVGLVGVLAL